VTTNTKRREHIVAENLMANEDNFVMLPGNRLLLRYT